MQKRKFDELISHFNRKVADMSIDQKYKMELLGMISAIGFAHENELGTDCISREQAIETFKDCAVNGVGIDGIVDALKQLPPIQPKKGKWRHYEQVLKCSECGSELYDEITEYFGDDVPHFCPNCGADMRGEQDG